MSAAAQGTILLVEDDADFAASLARSLARRGFGVVTAASHDEMVAALARHAPTRAVVDLKLGAKSGLACVATLHAHDPGISIVVLTGFASIATAVEAIKLGARHYLTKPSNTDDILAAFSRLEGDAAVGIGARPSSIKTVEWETIHAALMESDFNISETARRLGMHRRTLARKLQKREVK